MKDEISISLGEDRGEVQGFCTSQFEPVLDVFVQNFLERGELGASACVTLEGETVLDVWGGTSQTETHSAWSENTISGVMSTSKGITAIVANMLIDRGLLDPEQPVAEIWPEYACNGKENTTVRMTLDHTAGVPALRAPVKTDGFYDWAYMAARVAAEEAFWVPGTRQGYHALTYGFIVGELIRRASNKSVGENIQEMLSKPLGLDLWCGLPEEFEDRVAPLVPIFPEQSTGTEALFLEAMADTTSLSYLLVMNQGGWHVPQTESMVSSSKLDERASHAAEIPAANCITNARGLAGAYRPFALGGSADGTRFVGPETLVGMETCSASTHFDESMGIPTAWSLGFGKGLKIRRPEVRQTEVMTMGCRAFGHPGAGGSIGFADPEPGLSFGYTMNSMDRMLMMSDRSQLLIDTTYQAMGYRSRESGFWIR